MVKPGEIEAKERGSPLLVQWNPLPASETAASQTQDTDHYGQSIGRKASLQKVEVLPGSPGGADPERHCGCGMGWLILRKKRKVILSSEKKLTPDGGPDRANVRGKWHHVLGLRSSIPELGTFRTITRTLSGYFSWFFLPTGWHFKTRWSSLY